MGSISIGSATVSGPADDDAGELANVTAGDGGDDDDDDDDDDEEEEEEKEARDGKDDDDGGGSSEWAEWEKELEDVG